MLETPDQAREARPQGGRSALHGLPQARAQQGYVRAMNYAEFLESKRVEALACGFDPTGLNPKLFDFQRDIVRWACRRGKAAIFADCGLGKTPMQLEWARLVAAETGGRVLILAPLAVAQQTLREAAKFGIDAQYCRSQCAARGIVVTNYEMLHAFDPGSFEGVVLDESSILKAYDGKTRNALIQAFAETPFRLACTATPAPNDHMELGNHAEFLNTMTRTEMLAMFFIHDGGDTSKWRLKGHGAARFWEWLASWAVLIRKPSDLGYDDAGFDLPTLSVERHVSTCEAMEGLLFPLPVDDLLGQQRARRGTLEQRVARCAAMVNASDRPWLIWCDLNDESAALAEAIPGSVEVRGSQSNEDKESALMAFSRGKTRVLVTKPSIAGFGMNWQHCENMAFVGLSHSYEQYYQAIRRCWRFGQTRPVNVHLFTSDLENGVVDNVMRKERAAMEMGEKMVEHTKAITEAEIRGTERHAAPVESGRTEGDQWTMLLGDCVEQIDGIADDSIGYTLFSPPFASLYTYTNSTADMGNVRNDREFAEHFAFLVPELMRVTMPGRLLSFHCMNLPLSKERDGVIGLRDFRGELIRVFVEAGFIYHSEVCIWKDPVTAMQRTKALGLLHKQIRKDAAMSRQGIADYVVTMRKPGTNDAPVAHTDETMPVSLWQRFASPVWMDVNASRTLQYRAARENEDERHICPLQLDVIERCLRLWTNPGDLVLSPFAGIGSEGYVAIAEGRRFIGIELKRSYYDLACKNLLAAVHERDRHRLAL